MLDKIRNEFPVFEKHPELIEKLTAIAKEHTDSAEPAPSQLETRIMAN